MPTPPAPRHASAARAPRGTGRGRGWRIAGRITLTFAGLLAAAWGVGALWFQAPAGWRMPLLALWCALALAALAGIWLPARPRFRRAAFWCAAPACVLLLAWWQTLAPLQHRDWADDVARLPEAELDGDRLLLRNVRNFDWRSDGDYDIRWDTRSYDLRTLASADLLLSYWMGPHIAHTLVSFGFADGRQLVFSLEIRKERGEAFSALAGFFRRYEAVLVAADEHDIVRVRSNVRGEDVRLFRLRATPAQLRALLAGYLGTAAELRASPRFYNTLTTNCTTVVFDLARKIAPGLPADWRLLLSGHLDDYALDQGVLAPDTDLATLRAAGAIGSRANAYAGPAEGFSRAIRMGVPGIAEATP